MNGITLTKIVDDELANQGKTRLELCEAIGITSSAYSNWKNGAMPRKDKIVAIEKFLGIDLAAIEKSMSMDDETAEVLQWLREDFSHRALFESAKGLTKEQAYATASFIEKLKAGET